MRSDVQTNALPTTRFDAQLGQWVESTWADVVVGDLVRVAENELVTFQDSNCSVSTGNQQ